MKDILQKKGKSKHGISLSYSRNIGIRYNNLIKGKKEGYHILIGYGFSKKIQFYYSNNKFDIEGYFFNKEYMSHIKELKVLSYIL